MILEISHNNRQEFTRKEYARARANLELQSWKVHSQTERACLPLRGISVNLFPRNHHSPVAPLFQY